MAISKKHPNGLQDPFFDRPINAEDMAKGCITGGNQDGIVQVTWKEKEFTLRMSLSGPVPCPVTRLEQVKTLLIDPWPAWVIVFDGNRYVVRHAEQDLDTGKLILHLGADWQEPETYQARLAELQNQGWEICP